LAGWKILSVCNAERSSLKARNRRRAQFVKMKGNLSATLARKLPQTAGG
jgi:hypothetical protein